MNAINMMTVVKDGRVTVNVPAEDGTSVQVIIIPRRRPEEAEALLREADRLRAETPARAPEPGTLKRWIEEGRA
ncbi:hypothetical protein [Rhodocaloribacter litoris]|uniref:hypothetical protein n=1 Tax=Rhodocaloribacter litoris TaxID=2558931 RepID=UPI001E35D774|nr:hypothetical protein [Rhodocaloribacter litoris]